MQLIGLVRFSFFEQWIGRRWASDPSSSMTASKINFPERSITGILVSKVLMRSGLNDFATLPAACRR
jgi:hypothetical protein